MCSIFLVSELYKPQVWGHRQVRCTGKSEPNLRENRIFWHPRSRHDRELPAGKHGQGTGDELQRSGPGWCVPGGTSGHRRTNKQDFQESLLCEMQRRPKLDILAVQGQVPRRGLVTRAKGEVCVAKVYPSELQIEFSVAGEGWKPSRVVCVAEQMRCCGTRRLAAVAVQALWVLRASHLLQPRSEKSSLCFV